MGDQEVTLTRFLSGLKSEIDYVIELQHYEKLEDIIHIL